MNKTLTGKVQKQVVAKTLKNLNCSVSVIAKSLGVNRTTVYRYANKPTPKELEHFATEIQQMYFIKQGHLLAKCINRLETIIPDELDSKNLIMAIKVLNEYIESVKFHESNDKKEVDIAELSNTEAMIAMQNLIAELTMENETLRIEKL